MHLSKPNSELQLLCLCCAENEHGSKIHKVYEDTCATAPRSAIGRMVTSMSRLHTLNATHAGKHPSQGASRSHCLEECEIASDQLSMPRSAGRANVKTQQLASTIRHQATFQLLRFILPLCNNFSKTVHARAQLIEQSRSYFSE